MNWLTFIQQENITKKTFFEVIANAYLDKQCELDFHLEHMDVKFLAWCADPIVVTYGTMDYVPPPWLDALGFLGDYLEHM